ncbi:hypothetical protein Taro_028947, partial [Colocasia esculenta]|nr:hypothetical protein [Colocasia esculenta]
MKWCVPLCFHGLEYDIPCEAPARSRETDSSQVCYWFNRLGRGIPSQLIQYLRTRRPDRPHSQGCRDSTSRRVQNATRAVVAFWPPNRIDLSRSSDDLVTFHFDPVATLIWVLTLHRYDAAQNWTSDERRPPRSHLWG